MVRRLTEEEGRERAEASGLFTFVGFTRERNSARNAFSVTCPHDPNPRPISQANAQTQKNCCKKGKEEAHRQRVTEEIESLGMFKVVQVGTCNSICTYS